MGKMYYVDGTNHQHQETERAWKSAEGLKPVQRDSNKLHPTLLKDTPPSYKCLTGKLDLQLHAVSFKNIINCLLKMLATWLHQFFPIQWWHSLTQLRYSNWCCWTIKVRNVVFTVHWIKLNLIQYFPSLDSDHPCQSLSCSCITCVHL